LDFHSSVIRNDLHFFGYCYYHLLENLESTLLCVVNENPIMKWVDRVVILPFRMATQNVSRESYYCGKILGLLRKLKFYQYVLNDRYGKLINYYSTFTFLID
jgi:hypothetical protein